MPVAELFLNLHRWHLASTSFSESDISELDAIAQLFPLNFDETGNQIKQILEKRYTDGISGFEGVKVVRGASRREGSKIIGVFSDIVSPVLTKKFNFSIDSDTGDVDYTQIDTGNLEQNFSEYEFAAPGSKSKQCKEGKSSACTRADSSTYCIKVGYKCKSVGLSGEEKAVVKAIVEKGGKGQKRKGSPSTTGGSTPTTSAPSAPLATTTPSATSAVKKNSTSKKTAASITPPASPDPDGNPQIKTNDLKQSKPGRSQRLQDMDVALKNGDFSKVADITEKIYDDAGKLKLNPGEEDAVLKQLYKESGFDGKPAVKSEKEMNSLAASGSTMMVRGVTTEHFADQFRNGDYFVGNGQYGNGTYVGNSGSLSKDGSSFIHGGDTESYHRTFDEVAKRGYITPDGSTLRMALSNDAVVVTQKALAKQIAQTEKKVNSWEAKEKVKIMKQEGDSSHQLQQLKEKANKLRLVLWGDLGDGASGRYAITHGIDAIALNKSYQPNTFMNLLNRSKVTVQDTNLKFTDGQKKGVGV
ncbi:hypothetical protein [Nostoc sp. NMS7]|nr:hypothetical protein [Nostoc sp. NMS7]